MRSQGAYFEGDCGIIVLCTLFLVSCIFFNKYLFFILHDWVPSGQILYISMNLSISSRLSNLVAYCPYSIPVYICDVCDNFSSFISDFVNMSLLCVSLVNLARVLSILLIFSKIRLFVLLPFLYSLFPISFNSALIFVISFLLLTLGFFCSFSDFCNVFKDCIYLFLERGEDREKERKRNINVWLPLT